METFVADVTTSQLVQQRSMLVILIAACRTAQTAFDAADNIVDRGLLAELAKMIERSEQELSQLAEQIKRSSGG
jgi:hypothetical protein